MARFWDVVNAHVRSVRERNAVTQQTPRGDPIGGPPGTGAGAAVGNLYAGGAGFAGGTYIPGEQSTVEAFDAALPHRLPPRRHPAIMFPWIFQGTFNPAPALDLWATDPRPAQDVFTQRRGRTAVDSYASLKAYGSSDVASGPEGTKVLFPPRIPRALATRRAVQGAKSGNTLLNYANDHIAIPDVPVVGVAFAGRGAP